MARTPINHRVTAASPYVVPAGHVAQFSALSVGMTRASVIIDGNEIAVFLFDANAIGPLFANEGAVIASGEMPFGVSGFIEEIEA